MVKRKEQDESSTIELRRSTRVRKAPKSYFDEYACQDYLTLTEDAEPINDEVEDLAHTDNESDIDDDEYDSSFIDDDVIEDEVYEDEEEEEEFTSDLESEDDVPSPPHIPEQITQQIIEHAQPTIELDLNF